MTSVHETKAATTPCTQAWTSNPVTVNSELQGMNGGRGRIKENQVQGLFVFRIKKGIRLQKARMDRG